MKRKVLIELNETEENSCAVTLFASVSGRGNYNSFWRLIQDTFRIRIKQHKIAEENMMKLATIAHFCLFYQLLLHGNDGGKAAVDDESGEEVLGPTTDGAKKRGEAKLEEYESNNSPCWTEAVSELKTRCSEMTDLEQSILAMKFANCHFEKSGMKVYDCINKDHFKRCTNAMKNDSFIAFLTYTEFFTHVKDICYYLQSVIWRKQTAQTISRLAKIAGETVENLDASLKNQDLVLKGQNISLKNQEEILQNEKNLKVTLQNSTATAKAAFEEMKQKADEQKAIFSQTFDGVFSGIDKLAQLQTMLLGEFIGLQSLAFYIAALITCYFATSSPRTIGARLALFTAFSLLVVAEKLIVDWSFKRKSHFDSPAEWLHENVWFARKVFIAVSVFILGYVATRYKDLNQINNVMLKEIQQRILEIHEIEKANKKRDCIDGPNKKLYLANTAGKTKFVPQSKQFISLDNMAVSRSSSPRKKQPLPFDQFVDIFNQSFQSKETDMLKNTNSSTAKKKSRKNSSHEKRKLFSDDENTDEGRSSKQTKVKEKRKKFSDNENMDEGKSSKGKNVRETETKTIISDDGNKGAGKSSKKKKVTEREKKKLISDGENTDEAKSSKDRTEKEKQRRTLFSDDENTEEGNSREKNKAFSKKKSVKRTPLTKRKSDTPVEVTTNTPEATRNHDLSIISRYNLRARSITPVNSPSSSGVAASSSVSRSKKDKTPQVKSPPLKFEHGKGLFSSDEDGT